MIYPSFICYVISTLTEFGTWAQDIGIRNSSRIHTFRKT